MRVPGIAGILLLALSCQRAFDNPWDPLNITYGISYVAPLADSGSVPVDPARYRPGAKPLVLRNTGSLRKVGQTLSAWRHAGVDYQPGPGPALFADAVFEAVWAPSGGSLSALTANPAPNSSRFAGLALGASGGAYAAGYVNQTGSFSFGTPSYAGPAPNNNAVVLRVGSGGAVEWIRGPTGGSGASQYRTVVGTSQGVAVAGFIHGTGTYTFAPGKTAQGGASGNNATVVHYSAIGDVLWARAPQSGTATTEWEAVTVVGDRLVAAGNQGGIAVVSWAAGITTTASDDNFGSALAAGFDVASGDPLWARVLSMTSSDHTSTFYGAAAWGDRVALVGQTEGTGTWGSYAVNGVPSGNDENLFVLLVDPSGQAQGHLVPAAGSAPSEARAAGFLPDGRLAVVGSWKKTSSSSKLLLPGNEELSVGVVGANNLFLTILSPSGQVEHLVGWTAAGGASEAFAVTTDAWGNLYVVGRVASGVYQFGTVSLTGHHATHNLFVLKLLPNLEPEWIRGHSQTSSPQETQASAVAVGPSRVWVAGYANGTVSYPLGGSVAIVGQFASGNNAFLASWQR